MDDSVAGVDGVALADVEFHHASAHFAGDAHGGAFNLALDGVRRLVHVQETEDGDGGGDEHHHGHGQHYGAALMTHLSGGGSALLLRGVLRGICVLR